MKDSGLRIARKYRVLGEASQDPALVLGLAARSRVLDALLERPGNDLHAALDLRVVEVDHDDIEALGRHLLGDSASHVSGTDDGQGAKRTVRFGVHVSPRVGICIWTLSPQRQSSSRITHLDAIHATALATTSTAAR